MGQFSYYRQFIPRFASVAEPLTSALKFADGLLKKKRRESDGSSALKSADGSLKIKPWESDEGMKTSIKAKLKKVGRMVVEPTPERMAALGELKRLLISAPCLIYPDFDKMFYLYTDASRKGIGGTLQQEKGGKQHPVLFISRALSPAEKSYSATELECLGVYWCFSKLSHYIDGSHLTVITDHQALQWLWNIKSTTNSRLYRWAILLLPYKKKLKIIHRSGIAHSNVDLLSRFPCNNMTSTITSTLSSRMAEQYGADEDFAGWMKDLKRAQSVASTEKLGRVVPGVDDDAQKPGVQSVASLRKLGRSVYPETVPAPSGCVYPEVTPPPDVRPSYALSREGLLTTKVDGQNVICVLRPSRSEVLRLVHDELGHPGFKRALEHARTRFYWPGMFTDLKSFCRSCHECQMVKTDTSKKPRKLHPIEAIAPLHTLCIDFVEGLPPKRGFDSLATITDKFTKAIRLVPCKKSDSGDDFARHYFEKVYPAWGVPSVLISDRDRRFSSAFWSSLMRLAGTKLAMTTAYHPQADGQSE